MNFGCENRKEIEFGESEFGEDWFLGKRRAEGQRVVVVVVVAENAIAKSFGLSVSLSPLLGMKGVRVSSDFDRRNLSR